MRPLKLKMTNFGPYRHEVIDFDQLMQDPVFLISGDTGSGKTMIFDAMVYALFGTTAGDRPVKVLRSTFATQEDPVSEVTFYFEQADHIYCVRRVLEQWVKKKRGTGMRHQKQEVTLSVVESPDGQVIEQLASGPSKVGPMMNDLLQMNAEQFKQIILLPQNQFSRFLKANTADKLPILKTIFGTRPYDEFMQKLKDRQSKAAKKQEKRQAELNFLYQDSIWGEQGDLINETPETEKMKVVTQVVADSKKTFLELEALYESEQVKLEKMEQNLQSARQMNDQFKLLHQKEATYQSDILEQADRYQAQVTHRQQLLFAKRFEQTVTELKRVRKQIQLTQTRLISLEEDLAANQNDQLKLEQEDHQIKERGDELVGLPSKINQWNSEREHALRIKDLQEQLKTKQVALSGLEEKKKGLEEKFHQLNNRLEELEKNQLLETDLLKGEGQYQRLADYVDNRLEVTHDQVEADQMQVRRLQETIADQRKEVTQLEAELEQETALLETKKANRRQLMVAQLRQELEDGQACVVCGSLDHPFAHDEIEADEQALKELLEEVELLGNQVANLTTTLTTKRTQLEHQEQLLQEATQSLEGHQTNLEKDYHQFKMDLETSLFEATTGDTFDLEELKKLLASLKATLTSRRNQYEAEQDELKALGESLEAYDKDFQALEKEINHHQTLIAQFEADIDGIMVKIPGLETVQQYDENIKKAQQSLADYENDKERFNKKFQAAKLAAESLISTQKEVVSQLHQDEAAQEKLKAVMKEGLAEKDALTHDAEELKEWLQNLSQLDRLIQTISAFETTKKDLENEIKGVKEQLKEAEEKDLTEEETHFKAAKAAQLARLEAKTQLQQRLTQQEEKLKELEALHAQASEATEAMAALNSLSNFVNGSANGQVRLNLVTYVMREYLIEVIDYANRRFYKELTGGRYFLEIHDAEGQGNSQVGLEIDVRDTATDISRPVSTLSGGETFVTALAVALSMSEIVQNKTNGATIEALFVDEGFGTLDKEALDRAMTALEDVGKNKMVGVISHVDEMKSRIGQQLKVTKHPDGSSSLSVESFD